MMQQGPAPCVSMITYHTNAICPTCGHSHFCTAPASTPYALEATGYVTIVPTPRFETPRPQLNNEYARQRASSLEARAVLLYERKNELSRGRDIKTRGSRLRLAVRYGGGQVFKHRRVS